MKKETVVLITCGLLIAGLIYAANEITCNFTLKVAKGYLDLTRTSASQFTLNATSPNVAGFTQTVPTNTVGTAIGLGNVATNGVAWFHNLSTNNYVEIGVQDVNTNFLPLVRLNSNEAWPFRITKAVTPYARANTASVVLEYVIFDD